jgi:hypothetical protein
MFYGLKQLRAIFLVGGMCVFAGFNSWFYVQIWQAGSTPPNLSGQAVYGASAVGGVLGTFFAAVLGLQQFSNEPESQPGATLLRDVYGGLWLARIAIWLYAGVGAAALITVFFNQDQSPQSIKALASVFAGFALAIFIAAFSPSTQARTSDVPEAPAAAPDS